VKTQAVWDEPSFRFYKHFPRSFSKSEARDSLTPLVIEHVNQNFPSDQPLTANEVFGSLGDNHKGDELLSTSPEGLTISFSSSRNPGPVKAAVDEKMDLEAKMKEMVETMLSEQEARRKAEKREKEQEKSKAKQKKQQAKEKERDAKEKVLQQQIDDLKEARQVDKVAYQVDKEAYQLQIEDLHQELIETNGRLNASILSCDKATAEATKRRAEAMKLRRRELLNQGRRQILERLGTVVADHRDLGDAWRRLRLKAAEEKKPLELYVLEKLPKEDLFVVEKDKGALRLCCDGNHFLRIAGDDAAHRFNKQQLREGLRCENLDDSYSVQLGSLYYCTFKQHV